MMSCQRNICDVVTRSYWKPLARLTAHCPYLVIPAESSNSMLCCTIMEKGLGNNQALLQPAPGGYNLGQHTLMVEPAGGSLILQERRGTRIDGGWMTMRCEQGQAGHCVLVRWMQTVWGPYLWSYLCVRYDHSSISGKMWDIGILWKKRKMWLYKWNKFIFFNFLLLYISHTLTLFHCFSLPCHAYWCLPYHHHYFSLFHAIIRPLLTE